MNVLSTGGLIFSAVLLAACGSDSNSSNDPGGASSDGRFTPTTMNEEIVMRDKTTGLEWVNGLAPNSSKTVTGCHPMAPGLSTDGVVAEANNFCDTLNFAGHTDWRVPKVTELQKYTVDMKAAGLTPFYQNPSCPRVVGFNTNSNGMTTTISTVNTHNTDPIGKVNPWGSKNAGVRCVRETN